jgi:methylglutaconyl-CoA hydratase
MEEGSVNVHIEGGVGKIVFAHPKSNSLPSELLNGLAAQIDRLAADDQIKVLLISSEGDKTFCAGASFDELLAVQNKEEGAAFFSGFAKVILAMKACPKFIIMKVQGKAIGGGVGLIAAADYSFALESASIKLSELSIGIGPFVIGAAVQRKIGISAFSALSIQSTQWHSAQWAYEKNLYSAICLSQQEMDAAVNALLQNLSASSLLAMKAIKKMLWEGTEHWFTLLFERAAISGELVLSPQTKEILNQFKK